MSKNGIFTPGERLTLSWVSANNTWWRGDDDVFHYDWQKLREWPGAARCTAACRTMATVLLDDPETTHQSAVLDWLRDQVGSNSHRLLLTMLLVEASLGIERRQLVQSRLFGLSGALSPAYCEVLTTPVQVGWPTPLSFEQARLVAELEPEYRLYPPADRWDLYGALCRLTPPAESRSVRCQRIRWLLHEDLCRVHPMLAQYVIRVLLGQKDVDRPQWWSDFWSPAVLGNDPTRLAFVMEAVADEGTTEDRSGFNTGPAGNNQDYHELPAQYYALWAAEVAVAALRGNPQLFTESPAEGVSWRDRLTAWLGERPPELWRFLGEVEGLVLQHLPDREPDLVRLCTDRLTAISSSFNEALSRRQRVAAEHDNLRRFWHDAPALRSVTARCAVLSQAWPDGRHQHADERDVVQLMASLQESEAATTALRQQLERDLAAGKMLPTYALRQLVGLHHDFEAVREPLQRWLDTCLNHPITPTDYDQQWWWQLIVEHGLRCGQLPWKSYVSGTASDGSPNCHPMFGQLIKHGVALQADDLRAVGPTPWLAFRHVNGLGRLPLWVLADHPDLILRLFAATDPKMLGDSLQLYLSESGGSIKEKAEQATTFCRDQLLPWVDTASSEVQAAMVEYCFGPRIGATWFRDEVCRSKRSAAAWRQSVQRRLLTDLRHEQGPNWSEANRQLWDRLPKREQRRLLQAQLGYYKPEQIGYLWSTDRQRADLAGWLLQHPLFEGVSGGREHWWEWVEYTETHLLSSAPRVLEGLLRHYDQDVRKQAVALLQLRQANRS